MVGQLFYVLSGPAVRCEVRFKVNAGLIVKVGWLAYKRVSFEIQ